MFRTLAVATVVTALACATWAPSASAAKKHAKATPPEPAHAETIPGVNPMTNAPPAAPVANPQPYNKVPGVNPM